MEINFTNTSKTHLLYWKKSGNLKIQKKANLSKDIGLIGKLITENNELVAIFVSTIKKRDNIIDEIIQASPRLLLAVIIAIVISKKTA